MSRQSKGRRNLLAARAFSKARQSGSKGPAKTTPKHGKRKRTPANMRAADRPAGWAKAVLG